MKSFIRFLFILTLTFSLNSFSKITTCTFTNYTVENQGILPNTYSSPRHSYDNVIGRNAYNEGYIIIFGLNIVSDSGQRLTGIRIEHWGIEGFPYLLLDSAVITNRSGTILGVLGSQFGVLNGTIQIPGGVSIPADDTGANLGNDFFIGIRTRDDTIDGSICFIKVPGNAIVRSPSATDDTLNTEINTNKIVCELLVGDIMPIEYQPVHPPTDPDKILKYPYYLQYQPGEMIRPRYDTNSYDRSPFPFKRYVPQVIPWETQTAVIGIGCAQRNVVLHGEATPWMDAANAAVEEKLTSITITFTDIGEKDFDPSKSFFDPITNKPTITLWKDVNNNGKWEPNIDYKFTSSYTSFNKISDIEWEITILPPEGSDYFERIETIREGSSFSPSVYDYFIVIQLVGNPSDPTYRPIIGQDYKIWIKPKGIKFGPIGIPYQYAGISLGDIKTLYNIVYLEDLSQKRIDGFKNEEAVDKTYNTIPVIGINIASSSQYNTTKIKNIKVEILAFENFNPQTDLAPLTNQEFSGITLWRDNKERGDIGSFDIEDTFIPCNFTGWEYKGFINDPIYGPCHLYSTTLTTSTSAQDQGLIYPYDWASEYQGGGLISFPNNYRGSDFFICIRPSYLIKYNSKFRVRVPKQGLTLTYPAEGRYNSLPVTTKEIYGNVYTEIVPLTEPGNPNIGPNSQPTPIFKVILNDNGSGKNPKLEGLTVEFYNRGNFTLDDLKDFSFIYPVYNDSTGWYDVTFLNTEELKKCGVVMYGSDINGNIDWNNPIMIKRYRILSYGQSPSAYQFEFTQPVSIPNIIYVVIRTSSTFTPGDSFDAGIVSWGLTQSDWEFWASRAIPIIDKSGLRTNVYARKQSGSIFNPEITGSISVSISSSYEYIELTWTNQTGKYNEFDHYSIIRNGIEIPLLPTEYPYWANLYLDSKGNLLEGVQYQYRLRMYYWQGGELKYIESNIVPDPLDPYFSHKGKLLGFPDYMAPTNVRAVGGINTITIFWRDNSYDKNYPTLRADRFLIRRTKLSDGTFFETTVFAHTEPEWVDYVWYDSYFVQPQVKYRYEVYAQRMGIYGIVESKPGVSNEVWAYGSEGIEPGASPSGGGCFIATIVFGSPLAKQVYILREFRDRVLLKNTYGKKFVRWYYRNGPKMAEFISRYSFLKPIVRITLYPLIGICWLIIKGFLLYILFFISLIFLFKILTA